MSDDLKERLRIVSILIGDVPDKWQVELTMDGEKFAFLRADDFRKVAQFAARIEALEAQWNAAQVTIVAAAQYTATLEAQLAEMRGPSSDGENGRNWKVVAGKMITGETLIFDNTFIVAKVTRREDAEAIINALGRPQAAPEPTLEEIERVQAKLAFEICESLCESMDAGENETRRLAAKVCASDRVKRAILAALNPKDPSTTDQAEYIARYGTDDGL